MLTQSSSTFDTLSPQAPIKVFGVEGRYAHALFSAASQKNSVEKVEKELTDFQVHVHVNIYIVCMHTGLTYTYAITYSIMVKWCGDRFMNIIICIHIAPTTMKRGVNHDPIGSEDIWTH